MTSKYPIVVGIDFGPTGDAAMRMAMELGSELPNAELHLTTVVIDRSESPSAARIAEDERLLAEAARKLREYADEHRGTYEGASFEREVVLHVRLGDAAEALHQVAVDVDASLIIVGTRGNRGLAKLVLGSVSERLVKLAHLPVLVARPKDFTGMDRSVTRPEAPRPGQTEEDLHAPPTYALRGRMAFGGRGSHVSGAI